VALPSLSEGVVLAAGSGLRLHPLTATLPKPLLEIAEGVPIIDIVARTACLLGVSSLWIIASTHETEFRKWCSKVSQRYELDANLHMLSKPTRTNVETLRQSLEIVDRAPVVLLGDDVTLAPSLQNLRRRFERLNPAVLQAVTREGDRSVLRHTCQVTLGSQGLIESVEEKPAVPSTDVRGCGIYLLSEAAMSYLGDDGSACLEGITDLVAHFASGHRAAYEFIDGININVNTTDDLTRARTAYANWSHQSGR
jgi:NDP-sugar pyrophosphorylase family protein